MARLIDADVAMEVLLNEVETSGSNCIHINTIKRLLQDIPTAYDVEKVVGEIMQQFGCKDCEYADETDNSACIMCCETEVLDDICNIVRKGGVE